MRPRISVCHGSLKGECERERPRGAISATRFEQIPYDDETEFYRLEDNTGVVHGIWIQLHHTMSRN